MRNRKTGLMAIIGLLFAVMIGSIAAYAAVNLNPAIERKYIPADDPNWILGTDATKLRLQYSTLDTASTTLSPAVSIVSNYANAQVWSFGLPAKENHTWTDVANIVFRNCGYVMGEPINATIHINSVQTGKRYPRVQTDKYAQSADDDVDIIRVLPDRVWASSTPGDYSDYVYPGSLKITYTLTLTSAWTGAVVPWPAGMCFSDIDQANKVSSDSDKTIDESVTLNEGFKEIWTWPSFDRGISNFTIYPESDGSIAYPESYTRAGFLAVTRTNGNAVVTIEGGNNMSSALDVYSMYNRSSFQLIKRSTNNEISSLPQYTYAGIEYTLYEGHGTSTPLKTITLSSSGTHTRIEVPAGNYTLVETKTNKWYKRNPDPIYFTTSTGENKTIYTQDEPNTGTIRLVKRVRKTEGSSKPENTDYIKLLKFNLAFKDTSLSLTHMPISVNPGKSVNVLTGETKNSDYEYAFVFTNVPYGEYVLSEDGESMRTAEEAALRSGNVMPGGFDRDQSMKNLKVVVDELTTITDSDGETVPEFLNYWNTDARLRLEITKEIRGGGAGVDGWKFELYDNEECEGSPVARTDETDENGVAVIENIAKPGLYYLKETTKSKTHTPEVNPKPVTVAKSEKNTELVGDEAVATTTVNFANERNYVNIKLRKFEKNSDGTDSDNVNGILFTLYNAETGSVIAREYTGSVNGEDGIIVFNGKKNNITDGRYVLEETGFDGDRYIESAYHVDGYDNPAQEFTLTGDEGVYESEYTHFTNILNPPPGKFTVIIQKSAEDKDTSKLPAYTFYGITYDVFLDEALTDRVGTITLNEAGTGVCTFEVEDEDEVTVWVKERDALTDQTHYKKDNNKYSMALRNGEAGTFQLEDEAEYGSLDFTKVIEYQNPDMPDKPNASKLSFRLTNLNDPSITFTQSVQTTNGNRVVFTNIPIGRYRIEELGTTDPYYMDRGLMQNITGSTVNTINIAAGRNRINDENKWENYFLPPPDLGGVDIYKTTDDGTISDFSIFKVSIKNLDTNEYVAEGEPFSANGFYSKTLPAGRYQVKEVLTEEQARIYDPMPGEKIITVRENAIEHEQFTIVNELKTAKIVVKKRSTDGNVSDIEFTLHGTADDGTVLTGLKAYTHQETDPVTGEEIGVCEFRGIRAGTDYVIEETGFDALKYTSNHNVAGYDKPAIKVSSDGISDETVTFINTPYKFQLEKKEVLENGDTTNDPVAFAGYTLYKLPENDAGQVVIPTSEDEVKDLEALTFKCDENGKIDELGTVTRGTYLVYETGVPEGYIDDRSVPDDYPISGVTESTIGKYIAKITFNKTNQSISLLDTNRRKYGSVTFEKTDEYGQPVEGAEFTLYLDPQCSIVAKNKDNRMMVVTTDKYGRITDPITHESYLSGLEWRKYYLKETKKPTGYKKNSKVYPVDINQYNTEAVVKDDGYDGILNERGDGKVLLHKVDAATKDPIIRTAGADRAMFDLYASDNTVVREGLVPDENGDLLVEGLAWGSYYFKETRAPSGYTISPNLARFSINFSAVTGVPQEITMEDSKARASIVATVKIRARDYWKDHGNPTFIAVLTNKATSEKMTRPVTFTEKAVTSTQSGGYASLSTTFDIDSGEYQLKIYPADRFRLDENFQPEPINTLECDTAHSVDDATVDFNVPDDQTGRATYVYIKDDWSDFGDQTTITNIIKKSKAFTGLSVMYLGDEDNVEAGMPFTKDLLSVYALYDDGSAIQIGPGCEYDYVVTDSNGDELTRFPTQAGSYTYTVTANIEGITRTGIFQVTVLQEKKVKIYLHTDGAVVGGTSSGTCPIDNTTAQYIETYQHQTIPLTSAIYTDVTPPVGKMIDTESGSATGWFEDKNFEHPIDPYAEITQDTHYYLKLTVAKYKVSYFSSAPSGVTVSDVPEQQTKVHDIALTLSGQSPSISAGYDFLGWGTTQNGRRESDVRYRPGDSYTANAPINLYAVWKPHTATLTYNPNGGRLGSVPETETMRFDNAAYVYSASVPINTQSATPFAYWNTKANDTGDIYYPGDMIKDVNEEPADTELFAIFKAIPPRTKITGTAKDTVTCTAVDQVGITSYYFGTSSSPSDSDFESVSSSTNFSVTKDNLSSGTYYFIAKSSSGMTSDPVSVDMVPFKVNFYKDGPSDVITSGGTADLAISSIRETGISSYIGNWPAGANYIIDNIVVTDDLLEYDGILEGSDPLTGSIGSSGSEIKILLTTKAVLTYDANLGSTYAVLEAEDIPSSQSMAYSEQVSISRIVPTRRGFKFASWNTEADGTGDSYQPGDEFKAAKTVAQDTTLYAQWTQLHLGDEELTWEDVEFIGNNNIAGSFFNTDFTTIRNDLADDGQITVANLDMYTKEFSADGNTVHAYIAGFDHDELTEGGTAAITFMSYESVGRSPMQISGNSNGWESSTARTLTLNGATGVYETIDEGESNNKNKLKSRIRKVNKEYYDNEGVLRTPSSGDYLFLPSAEELYGAYGID